MAKELEMDWLYAWKMLVYVPEQHFDCLLILRSYVSAPSSHQLSRSPAGYQFRNASSMTLPLDKYDGTYI
jgi:hypothetical protein